MILGICGRTGSGKSTVADMLSQELDAPVFCLDTYFAKHIDADKITNFEDPVLYDTKRLRIDVARCQQRPIIIVEGFVLYMDEDMLPLFTHRIYLDITDETLIKRRLHRTNSVFGDNFKKELYEMDYITGVILPESAKQDTVQKSRADAIVDANRPFDEVFWEVKQLVQTWREQ